MNAKQAKHYAKMYSQYKITEEDNTQVPPAELKKIRAYMEDDFVAGFLAAGHFMQEDGKKLSMLKVILDQKFSEKEVDLKEIGEAVGISLGYL